MEHIEGYEQMPFDKKVAAEIKAFMSDLLLRHPEVKALATSICWNDNLNDAKILHGVWVGESGPVNTPDGIIGSMWQTLKLLDTMLQRGTQYTETLQQKIIELHKQAVNINAQSDQTRAEETQQNGQS